MTVSCPALWNCCITVLLMSVRLKSFPADGIRMCIPTVLSSTGGHRALADIIESIDELRYYREMMFVPDPGPTFDQAVQGCAHVEGTSLLREYEQEGDPLTDRSSAEKKDY